jgi:excisionase family DNA binding protein
MAKLLTITEAAERIGRSVETTRRMVYRGKLPAAKIGGVWYVSDEAIEQLLSGLALTDEWRERAQMKVPKQDAVRTRSATTAPGGLSDLMPKDRMFS